MFEYICDICGLFACVSECGPFLLCFERGFFLCGVGVGVSAFDWEGVIVEDVVDDVEFSVMVLFLQVVCVESMV